MCKKSSKRKKMTKKSAMKKQKSLADSVIVTMARGFFRKIPGLNLLPNQRVQSVQAKSHFKAPPPF